MTLSLIARKKHSTKNSGRDQLLNIDSLPESYKVHTKGCDETPK